MNFEDERLLEMTSDDLNTILEIGLELSGTRNKPYLFLDEIQNIDGWEKFVRRIADMKYKVNITGSNSKMLSSEIASTLGGRFVIMNVYPYSFAEYLVANGKKKITWIPSVQVIKQRYYHCIMNMLLSVLFLSLWISKTKEPS